MNYHKVLERQINKLLPEAFLKDEDILNFLSTISNSYTTFEKDKKISQHAFDVSEKEYQELNKYLFQQNEIMRQSIVELKEAIRSLDSDAIIGNDESDNNLINIISFLRKQITRSKEIETHLIKAKEFAEKAAMAKSDFLSVMSHEIRTPLNAITGYIHLLQNEAKLPEQVDFLRILKISADNLLSLINDVLDFEKIEEGKIVFARRDIDIRHLVNNIKMANKLSAEENGNTINLRFDDDIPLFIVGDEIRLAQVLNNLLSNAIKFTHNGKITIEVFLKSMTNSNVTLYFAVKDTGIGIAQEKQHVIFDRFTQENSNITREYGGSGLGLAIIRKLLLLRNSDIFVESQPGKGSTFYFTLEFGKSRATHRDEKAVESVKNDLMGARILLVEDVEFNVMLAHKILSGWQAEVGLAENGKVAVEKMKQEHYDLVLMDLQMPIMDGFTAAIEIRKFNTNTPIIALTASTSLEIQEKVFESGMNDYISKPLNPSLMYDTIYKHLQTEGTISH